MRAFKSGLAAVPRIFSGAVLSRGGPFQSISLIVDGLLEWRRRHRSRRQLQMLSDHMCKDIGVSSADVWREAGKPFWKA